MNLAFDVTPAKYVTGLITEKGICEASTEGLKNYLNEKFNKGRVIKYSKSKSYKFITT